MYNFSNSNLIITTEMQISLVPINRVGKMCQTNPCYTLPCGTKTQKAILQKVFLMIHYMRSLREQDMFACLLCH